MSALSEKVKKLTIELTRIYEPLSRHHVVMLYTSTALMALLDVQGAEADIILIKHHARHTADLKKRFQFSGSRTQTDQALDELKELVENTLSKYN